MKKTNAILALTAALAVGTVVNADVILINFGNGTVGNVAGNQWNDVTGTSNIENLKTTSDTASGIDLDWTTTASTLGASTTMTDGGPGVFDITTVVQNTVWSASADHIDSGNAPTFTLSGLDTNLTYDFVFYGARDVTWAATRTTVYRVAGLTTSDSANLVTTGPSAGDYNTSNTVSVTGMSPTALGVITVSFGGITDANVGYLTGMQVTAVPEPGTLVLVGIALGSLVFLRRRRR